MLETSTLTPEDHEESLLIKDCIEAVWNDRYMWADIWSPPRLGKTTLAGDILHAVYVDILHDPEQAWHHVLQATIFNLEQLIHRLRYGIPCRQYTLNHLHNRVPGLNWDDFGAYSNKATTQHSEAWDDFKGGFDVLGTKVGVLLSTMVDPSEPTFQLNNKFTHEIQVTSLGKYKYDKIVWQQDFRSNRIKIKKHCQEYGRFDPWPEWVYSEYDNQRCSLADEVFIRIEDKISKSNTDWMLKILQPEDYAVLQAILDRGRMTRENLEAHVPAYRKEIVVKLKAHNLIIPVHVQGTQQYRYDLTQLGLDSLKLERAKTENMQMQPKQEDKPHLT